MLGIPDDRPLTVTGGLAYAGGPGNNYTTHAIVNMVERLREQPGSKGLVTALGWYITTHAVGVYGTAPSENGWRRPDAEADQREIDAAPHPQLAERPDGPATIETYTVVHDREGEPDYAIVIGRLEDGSRFIANTAQDRSLLETMVDTEMIGVAGNVRHDNASEKNIFALS
jgi:acetyl-CoA C-acetyltransferase